MAISNAWLRLLPMVIAVSLCATTAPARADDPELYRVTYTVSSDAPVSVDVYYRDQDPQTWADYSHNPYQFTPKVTANIGPGRSWNLEVLLQDPSRWAMVTATVIGKTSTANLHCTLSVDAKIVNTAAGPRGALCSPRHW